MYLYGIFLYYKCKKRREILSAIQRKVCLMTARNDVQQVERAYRANTWQTYGVFVSSCLPIIRSDKAKKREAIWFPSS